MEKLMFCLIMCLLCASTTDIYGQIADSLVVTRWQSREIIMERISQALEEELYGNEMESSEKAVDAIGMAMEYFEYLLEHPLDINNCTSSELKELVILSDFQIESIMDYRINSGEILSATQLQLLHGFDEQTVQLLRPFISFDSIRSENTGFDSQLLLRGRRAIGNDKLMGAPYYILAKYKMIYNNKLQIGFTAENDAGELLFAKGASPVDFFSFHVAAKNMGKLDMLIIGDYATRFGQGLTMWNSFSLQGASSPMAFYKRGMAFTPYTSSNESNFCRGAAASFDFGKFDVNVMFSYNALDAKIKGAEYTSLYDTGLHNTLTSLANRRAMRETIGGINLSYMFDRLKIGASFVSYGYNKLNGRTVREYNKYQMYNGVWGNSSVDFYAIINRIKLFGEFAMDFGGSTAVLFGSVFNISDKFETGILLRNYSKSYIAPHAGAYSTISSVSNQRGAAMNMVYSMNGKWKFVFGAEGCHYPYFRYNINIASSMLKCYVTSEFIGDKITFTTRLSDSYTSHNALNRVNVKTQATMAVKEGVKVKLHASCVTAANCFGWQSGVNLKYETLARRLSIQIGGSWFECPVWNSRLYVYEPDMPYTYNSRLLYGNGCSLYALVKAEISSIIDVYLKGETMQYITAGKESKSSVKLATRIKF